MPSVVRKHKQSRSNPSKDDSPSHESHSSGYSLYALYILLLLLTVWALYDTLIVDNYLYGGDKPEYAGAETILRDLVKAQTQQTTSVSKIESPRKRGKSALKPSMTQEERTAILREQLNAHNETQEMLSLPVRGLKPTSGIQPLYGMKHQGGDAVFALACNYPKLFYQRFVGSLRKSGYKGDIVLAVSPVAKMKPGVEAYLKKMKVISYAFDVDCSGIDNCRLKNDFLGYPDPRPYRTFANIRYALYEYWLQYYNPKSYILILDFRDTFFQRDPFESFGVVSQRNPSYDLRLFQENAEVKTIGTCVFNSLWIGRCFGKPALAELKPQPVICSGSTLGSYSAIHHYIRTMLKSMDTVQCWLWGGIESDQGYQNFLYYNGFFNPPPGQTGNVTSFAQGEGIVNTIGAMNGFR